MQDFGTKADNSSPPGGQLSATEFNNLATENENAVLRSGQALSGASDTQLAQSLFLHSVKSSSFQDSGASNAYVATPVSGASGVLLPPDYSSMSGAEVKIIVSNNNSGASTLNIGQTGGTLLGTKKILNAAGVALVGGELVAGKYATLIYDPLLDGGAGAWRIYSETVLGASVKGLASNLKLSTTGLSAAISITTDEIALKSSANQYQTVRNVSVTPSFANAAGANGMDVGAGGTQAANTWYYAWVIYNPTTNTIAGLISLSSTAPTLPAGYTFAARVGAVRTDGTANKYPLCIVQNGDEVTLNVTIGTNTVTPVALATGILGNPTSANYVATAVAGAVPPTASSIDVFAFAYTAGATYGVSNGSGYGAVGSTNPPQIAYTAPTVAANMDFVKSAFRFVLTGPNLYVAANTADFVLRAVGWRDNL